MKFKICQKVKVTAVYSVFIGKYGKVIAIDDAHIFIKVNKRKMWFHKDEITNEIPDDRLREAEI